MDAAEVGKGPGVLEGGAPDRGSDGPVLVVDQVGLEGGEEAIVHGVVPAIAGPAEAGAFVLVPSGGRRGGAGRGVGLQQLEGHYLSARRIDDG